MNILAIESSCDETAVAVVKDGTKILSNVVASSHLMHEKYGGIVPEIAARHQLEYMIPTLTEALAQSRLPLTDMDAIAITVGPGLIGSLLVGIETAKSISATINKPIIPVNHVLAHMYANFVTSPEQNSSRALSRDLISFPAISLVVSGGHTELYLMKSEKELVWLGGTLDDAAGECFDKTARLLGFGNGGGPAIQEAAKNHNNTLKIQLPRPMLDRDNAYNFSFSGLKTAIMREAYKLQGQDAWNENSITTLAYEVQETVTDVLVKKTILAAQKFDVKSILLSGGVSANVRLREKFLQKAQDFSIYIPPINLCTDNAAYIASFAFFRGKPVAWQEITAVPDLDVEITN